MQRSSTLLLGPEDGWDREAEFHDEVWRSAAAGTTWFHVASLGGIERHLQRRASAFPHARTDRRYVVGDSGIVNIRSGSTTGHVDQPVKILSETWRDSGNDFCTDDFKIDRQIRLVAAEFGDHSEALVVSDVGDQQVTLQIRGDPASVLLRVCIDFYELCPPLNIDDLEQSLDKSCAEATA